MTAIRTPAPPGAGKIDELQLLRAIAAGLVVGDHSIARLWGRDFEAIRYFSWNLGDVGVAIFFVISGFIMVRATRNDFSKPGASGIFFLRRIERVVPLYWLATVPAAFLFFLDAEGGVLTSVAKLLKSLFFIPYADEAGIVRPIHGVGWTLNYEMFFYLIFAACMMAKRTAGIVYCVGIIAALVLAGVFIEGPAWGQDAGTPFAFWTYPIMLLFGAGMLLALANIKLRPLPSPAFLFFPLIAACAAVFLLTIKVYPVPIEWRFVVWTACFVYVALSVIFHDPNAAVTHIRRPFIALGNASYSTYLIHPFVLDVVASKLHIGARLGYPLAFAICLISSHLAGLLVYRVVEKPLTGYFARHNRKV